MKLRAVFIIRDLILYCSLFWLGMSYATIHNRGVQVLQVAHPAYDGPRLHQDLLPAALKGHHLDRASFDQVVHKLMVSPGADAGTRYFLLVEAYRLGFDACDQARTEAGHAAIH